MPPPGSIKRWSASVVRLSDVAYIGSNSKTKRPRKMKLCTVVPQVTCDSHTDFKVKRSKVKVTGGGILWRPPSRTACYMRVATSDKESLITDSAWYSAYRGMHFIGRWRWRRVNPLMDTLKPQSNSNTVICTLAVDGPIVHIKANKDLACLLTTRGHHPMVTRWAAEFRRGRRSLQDEHWSGRPWEAVCEENCRAIEKKILYIAESSSQCAADSRQCEHKHWLS